MPNRISLCYLLTEDIQQSVFFRRVLIKLGMPERSIHGIAAPKGGGSAERFVLSSITEYLTKLRGRYASTALIVTVDADSGTVLNRRKQIDSLLTAANVEKPKEGERYCLFVPRWNIETWIYSLRGEAVVETNPNYPKFTGNERSCHPQADLLAERIKARLPADESWPSSLKDAYADFEHIRDVWLIDS